MGQLIFVNPGPGQPINTAIATANPGDAIIVRPGVYTETVVVPPGKNDIRIVSDKPHKAILDGSGLGSGANGFTIESSGVEINGFVIRNFSSHGIATIELALGPTIDGCKFVHNHISHVGGRGISIANNSFENLLWKNKVRNTGSDGIFSEECCNAFMQNEVQHIGGVGIGETDCCTTFYQNKVNSTEGTGIQAFGCCSFVVNNSVKNSGDHGIHAENDENAIIGNKVRNTVNNGIRSSVEFGFDTILNNYVTNSGDTGIASFTEFNVIADNQITKSNGDGISLDPGLFFDQKNNYILQNKINRSDGDGIDVDAEMIRTFIGGNLITKNNSSGVDMSGDFSNIENNRIEENNDSGIEIDNTANETFILRNNLERNRPENITDNGTGTIEYRNDED